MISHPEVHMAAQAEMKDPEVLSQTTDNTGELSSPPKRKLISLQYNLSDSEDEESREERKARVVRFMVVVLCCYYHLVHVCSLSRCMRISILVMEMSS